MNTVRIRSLPEAGTRGAYALCSPASGRCRPAPPARRDLFNKLLASKAIARAVEDEARSKKSPRKAQQNAIALMEEIAANFSYEMIRLTDRILGFTRNRLYQGINVHNAERVRQLAHDGHEIVYVPCHRSHMDYMLLSYVLYHQGLVPPHIAAGINLNFWPAGPIFRRLGAFFIRRTFKGNKLYSTVFREYRASCSAAVTRLSTLSRVDVHVLVVCSTRKPAPCR